ncbi:hypothetical protein GNX18_08930 [Microbulbifer sp. SH-1]|uniref:polysaccharide pyruvyl transferase family protein n=1 Tax=Microbulbifer sp. SH-1 TaxID=2681547 RepID=UPI00140B4BA0|nr:polysaccharide pyruvyl transferase family protein [Microbulbifer sp. SH-1]QIL89861.1 hypothetical protein GNX18_08930 [Microbulbifer sp. SH-1]
MYKRVGVVGINLEGLARSHGTDALKASGNNFGNMLFTNAVYKQIRGCKYLGFSFDPVVARESFDSIIIPAANWINLSQDWQKLADVLDATQLPCSAIGLGAQLSSIKEVKSIPKGTKKLLKVVSERCHSFGVRGEFTAEVVRKLGVNNVEVLGCPSAFYYGAVANIREVDYSEGISNVGIGPTRYVLPGVSSGRSIDKQRQLYQFAIREASSIYYQSEAFEISILAREEPEQGRDLACAYYGVNNFSNLRKEILLKGKYHKDLEHWISDSKKDDVYIGTRIHGAIAATLGGTPAMLIAHDKRTAELAEQMCMPSISIEDFEISMLYDIDGFVKTFDFVKFQRRSALNLKRILKFYTSNGFESTISL